MTTNKFIAKGCLITLLFFFIKNEGFSQTIAKQNDGHKITDYWTEGKRYYDSGDYRTAKKIFEKGINSIGSDDTPVIARLKVQKALAHKKMNEYDSALELLNVVLSQHNLDTDNKFTKIKLFNSLANLYSDKGEILKSVSYYSQSLIFAQELNDSLLIARQLNNIGIAYSDLNLYESAIQSFFEAIEILEKYQDSRQLANVYNSVGLLMYSNKTYNKAIHYHRLALESRKKDDDQHGIAGSYNNLGLAYLDDGKLDSANYYLSKALEIKSQLNDQAYLSTTLINIADLNVRENRFENAGEYLEKALKISQDIDLPAITVEALLGFSKFHIKKRNYEDAKADLAKALPLSKELNDKQLIFNIYQQYQTLYEQWGDYENAYQYSQKYHALKDSLINEERIRVAEWNKELEKREVEKEKVIAEQKATIAIQENQRQKTWTLTLSVLILLLIALGTTVWMNRRKIKQQNAELLKMNRIIEIQKGDIRHQTKNSLLRVRNILKLLKKDISDQRYSTELEKAENMILSLTALEDYLFNKPEDKEVDMSEFLKGFREKLVSSLGAGKHVDIDLQCDPVWLHLNEAIPIALIISESITNSIKHAFENIDFPKIKLLFQKVKEGHLLVIEDNGRGPAQNGEPKEGGWGTGIVNAYLKQLGGTMNVSFENGYRREFVLKM